ncbi:hypothetical protein [Telluribacter humicola]|uniref:hypothetical protein n=1 Tax=Telluribacter humicola TaxID=1720261 RepID=UPI001A9716D6|nr:hypothetical protein [Telluribacter humicola]
MKPELTLDLKARFFAQYMGIDQEIVCYNGYAPFKLAAIPHMLRGYCASMIIKEGNKTTIDSFLIEFSALQLKILSDITLEDAVIVYNILNGAHQGDTFQIRYKKDFVKERYAQLFYTYKNEDSVLLNIDKEGLFHAIFIARSYYTLEAYDYLKSKGYAVPFMGYSVEELIEAGWIQIRKEVGHEA